MTTDVITLRQATTDDIAAIDRVLSQSYAKLLRASYPPSVQVLAVPIISTANPRLIASGRYYVATDADGFVMGAGGWSSSGAARAQASVRHLVTDHRHLRRGIASRIMEMVVSECRAAGVTHLNCLATRNAVPFYTAAGFTVDAPVTVGLRPGIDFPAIRMHRTL